MNDEAKKIKGLYVHIPFCDGKCFYCAFYSIPYQTGLANRYLRAVEHELLLSPPLIPETIYFGGGTPSLLSLIELQCLCNLIKENVSIDCLKEWTVECNPASLTAEKLALLTAAGVNRISLGAQSFDDSALKWLGRRHSVADIHEAVQMIKSAGFDNFGIDLIACIPGFKSDDWRKTLNSAVALKPKHISVYDLTSEEGSHLARVADSRKSTQQNTATFPQVGRDPALSGVNSLACHAIGVVPPDVCRSDGRTGSPALPIAALKHQFNLLTEDKEIEALDLAEKILTNEGYKRYEISNYAQPGFECLHNLSCWRGEEYIGLGPAAASHVGLKRWTNLPDLEKYLEAIENGKKTPRTMDVLTENLKKIERIVFGLRMAEGISNATGKICEKTLIALDEQGLVLYADGRWRLTERGFYLADYVGAELLAGGNAE